MFFLAVLLVVVGGLVDAVVGVVTAGDVVVVVGVFGAVVVSGVAVFNQVFRRKKPGFKIGVCRPAGGR